MLKLRQQGVDLIALRLPESFPERFAVTITRIQNSGVNKLFSGMLDNNLLGLRLPSSVN
jgi:hypothetical protein